MRSSNDIELLHEILNISKSLLLLRLIKVYYPILIIDHVMDEDPNKFEPIHESLYLQHTKSDRS